MVSARLERGEESVGDDGEEEAAGEECDGKDGRVLDAFVHDWVYGQ